MRILFKIVGAALLGAMLLAAPAEAANWFQNWGNNQNDDDAVFMKKRRTGGAAVVAHIDISSQTLTLEVNGWPEGRWAISSARAGYHTPRGSFGVTRTAKVYFSKKYDNAPMPNSVFFYGGYAVHGTYHIASLGRPASHGCVRLAPANAAAFYNLVQKYGASRTRVIVTD